VYYYNNSPLTLILHKDYDRTTVKDVFSIYVKKEKILFRQEELPEPFVKIIKDNKVRVQTGL